MTMSNRLIEAAIIDDGVHLDCFPLERKWIVDENLNISLYQNRIIEENHAAVCMRVMQKYADMECVLWHSIKVLKDDTKRGYIGRFLKALEFCEVLGVKLIHLSIGSTYYEDFRPIQTIVERLLKKGVILVSATSNEGVVTYPAYISNVIGVKCNPQLKDDAYMFRHDPIERISFHASSRHQLELGGQKIKSSVCNSYAAPLITAKVISHLINDPRLNCEELIPLLIAGAANSNHGEGCFDDKDKTDFSSNAILDSPDIPIVVLSGFDSQHLVDLVCAIHVGVYPYSIEFDPFLRHTSLLDPAFQISALISPAGWGLVGQVIGEWTVMSTFEPALNDIDTVFIPAFHAAEKVETLIIKEIEAIVPRLKKVICAANLSAQNIESLQVTCVQAGCLFENLNILKTPEAYGLTRPTEQNPPLEPLEVPIVAVVGLWEETDKFEASLVLREQFLQNGYRITQIGSRNCCELLGLHSFPGFMLDPGVDAVDKIIYFNRWVSQLAEAEEPDLILLTVPGAIQNLNETLTKGFGVLPHLVFQAVMVDFLLFCTICDEHSMQFLQEISTMCKYKFGCNVDCYHMSNLQFDLNASKALGRVVINRVYRDMVSQALEKGLKDSPLPIVNVFDQASKDKLFDFVVGRLSGEDFQIVS